MLTVRQIEKLWQSKQYVQLSRELLSFRAERVLDCVDGLALPAATAALAVIRLDELAQPFVPLYRRLIQKILTLQEADGGWGEAPTTALCVRALLCGRGDGLAIERGIQYLANLQKPDGLWPAVPIRRLPADPQISAFVLYQLAEHRWFRDAVRFSDAMDWFDLHHSQLDAPTRQVWDLLRTRCGRNAARPIRPNEAMLWS